MKTKSRMLAVVMALIMIIGLLLISAFSEGNLLSDTSVTIESADGENKKEDTENVPADSSGSLISGDAKGGTTSTDARDGGSPKAEAPATNTDAAVKSSFGNAEDGKQPSAATYIVTFDANGHGTAPTAVTANQDALITEPDAPSEDGYTFTGWYRDEAATEPWDFSKDKVTEDVTLYAGWSEEEPPADVAPALSSGNTYKIWYINASYDRPNDENYSGWPANTYVAPGTIVSLPPVFKSIQYIDGIHRYSWSWYRVRNRRTNENILRNNGTFEMPADDVEVYGMWIYGESCRLEIVRINGDGFVSADGVAGNYASGSIATVTVKPYDGYHFVGWRISEDGPYVSTESTYNFNIWKDTTLYAVFEPKKSHSITVIDGSADKQSAIEGEIVKLTPQKFLKEPGADYHWEFDKWIMEPEVNFRLSNPDGTCEFIMPDANVEARATYAKACTITVYTEPRGFEEYTVPKRNKVAKVGEYTWVDAKNIPGYRFVEWCWDDGHVTPKYNSYSNSYTYYFTAERDITLYAKYEKLPTITVQESEGGTGTASHEYAEHDGQEITLTAVPNASWVFDRWEVISGDVVLDDPSSATTTFVSNGNDVVVKPHFERLEVVITVVPVIYKVVNGTWADGTTKDKTEYVLTGSNNATAPTGMIAGEGFAGGSWDVDPNVAIITEATTFTYIFEALPAYLVTYAVEGGSFTQGTTTREQVYHGGKPASVPSGMTPDGTHKNTGAWYKGDTALSISPADEIIIRHVTFTYKFDEKDKFTVTINNGTADKTTAAVGETVTIRANDPAEGMAFVQWEYVDGVNFDRMDSIETTFPMPAKNVTVTPVYSEILIPSIDDQTYTGEPIALKFGLFNGVRLEGVDGLFIQDTHYTVTCDDIDAGPATATVTISSPRAGSKTATFQIVPAELKVTTGSATKAYDGTPLTQADGRITGLVNNETATVNPSGSQTYVGSSENGYAIDWDTAKAGNYNIQTESLGTLTVTAAEQKPTITATAMLYRGGSELDLSSLVSGAAGDVSFAIKSGDAATLSGTTLTPSANATGDVIINVNIAAKDVNGDGTPEYSAYTGDGAITVTVVDKEDAGVSITDGDVTKTYGDPAFSLAAAAANEGANGVWTWRSSDEAVATVDNDGKVTIVGKGSASITAAYESATTIGEATITLTVKSSGGGGGVTTQYTLTYNTGGGSSIASTKHSSGTTVNLTATPTKEGYTFDGWYSEAALTNKITSVKMDGNKTVYAGWEHDCPSKHLKDVDINAWYHEYIDYVVEKGLMQGVADDLFAPEVTTSRAMIVTILYRLEGRPAVSGSSPFDDVAEGLWYTDAVKWAEANEIVEGYGSGKFGPGDDITREQLAAILYRYASFKGYDVSKAKDLSGYSDASAISDWALAAMQWAVAEGLIAGRTTTTLVPGGNATRAEVAAILMRFIENVK